jgi:hypothetical protein
MFRKLIIAIAASGMLAACAHSRQTEDETVAQDPNAATTYATPDPVAAEPVATRPAPVRKVEKREIDEEKTEARREPDNTGINKRDTDDKTLTPLDQGNSSNDLKITQEIRKAVVGADGLSFTAKNVKIITRDANVVLRGPVKSVSEKTRIDELARGTAGVTKVDNQLEVESTN